MGDRAKGGLEEAMKMLNLSAVEKKGIKVGRQIHGVKGGDEWHAVGKAMSEKQIAVEGIVQTLGKIWCGDRGLACKDMGDNLFLFHFNHPMGAKRALEDGPWYASHSLLVMTAYDGSKTLEAMKFNHVPIWIRVSGLPMGMMNRTVAEIIGDEVGAFLDVDVEENGTAAGHFLRIKVRLDIRHPIRRGVTLEADDEVGEARWCPIVYEFLPDFCYKCGIIGHIDKGCRLGQVGGDRQYGNWLRVMPPRRRFSDDVGSKWSIGGRTLESNMVRSGGDWRRDKEERLRSTSRNTKEGREEEVDKEKGKKKVGENNTSQSTLANQVLALNDIPGVENLEATDRDNQMNDEEHRETMVMEKKSLVALHGAVGDSVAVPMPSGELRDGVDPRRKEAHTRRYSGSAQWVTLSWKWLLARKGRALAMLLMIRMWQGKQRN